jgi:hypothetical protein
LHVTDADAGNDSFDARGGGQIRDQGLHRRAAGPQGGRCGLEPIAATGNEHEVIAFVSEAVGKRCTDAAAGTGDQCEGSVGHRASA